MANTITHLYYGLEVVKQSDEEIKKIVENNKEAFIYGTMGPDFLFGAREIGLQEKRLANLMHAVKCFELFDVTAKHLRDNYDETKVSYMLGMLTHYVVDYHVHASVNFFVEQGLLKYLPYQYAQYVHNLIEVAGDEYVLKEFMGYANTNEYKLHKELKAKAKTKKKVGKLYKDVISKIYGSPYSIRNGNISRFLTLASFWVTRDKHGRRYKFFNWLEDRKGGKKQVTALMRPAVKYGEVDYLNFNHQEWRVVRNRGERMSNLDYIELLNLAVKTAATTYFPMYLKAIKEGTKIDKELFRVSFEGVDNAYIFEQKNNLPSPDFPIYEREIKEESEDAKSIPIEEESVIIKDDDLNQATKGSAEI